MSAVAVSTVVQPKQIDLNSTLKSDSQMEQLKTMPKQPDYLVGIITKQSQDPPWDVSITSGTGQEIVYSDISNR